ncbi:UPF0598 protein C8orf82 [Thecamonas trahens ATCC 50062]|uniref:UPF0598 protein C8orf82 n=1 Tax=Thecamonas trahens ATCC 50062 TaxID=461836 RepID=A0A0L0D2C7_THETB|nr:UPF0598 protein C8orf82 [Thecamonas trahens ATCC 50062]KNC46447.1 UPF0598 protein C8orf82 [Thecamonas trahens ATCC 50062]|eukprot:XP_013760738.1 UPF0598 protein C8orf82 [Thecamonas trahens ATCC 50062]
MLRACSQGGRVPETEATTTRKGKARYTRQYFYEIDSSGRVFLADAKHKNYATAYRDVTFLNDLFTRLKANKTGLYVDDGYDYVSPCGRELNFVTTEDITPYVFHTLHRLPGDSAAAPGACAAAAVEPAHGTDADGACAAGRDAAPLEAADCDDDGVDVLVYGAAMYVPFQPDALWISEAGRMYHPSPMDGVPGLVGDKLTMDLNCEVIDDPADAVAFMWRGERHVVAPHCPDSPVST